MKKLIQQHQKLLTNLLKWGILVLSVLFMYRELFLKRNFTELMEQYSTRCLEQWPILLIVILLMPLNWWLEAHKWKRLLRADHHLRESRAFAATASGVTVSVLTPNRVGEFAGRMLYVPPEHRDKAVAMSLAGSFSQLIITFVVGTFCGAWYFYMEGYSDVIWSLLIGIGCVFAVINIYYRLADSEKLFERWKYNATVGKIRVALSGLSKPLLTEALIWSGIRYVVFSLQLGLLMYGLLDFYIPDQRWGLIYMVPLYFFFQTMVPTIALSEIGVRGMLLSTLFADVAPEADLVLTSTLLWLINIVVPALLGGLFLLTLRFRISRNS
ncbi:MAG: hypothetical protein H6606_01125 [Flavobacteriales bacterium]|nr:hypothetical protein [Flavobacteriales bacterium]